MALAQVQDLGPEQEGAAATPDGLRHGGGHPMGEVGAHVALAHRDQRDIPVPFGGGSAHPGDPIHPPLDAPVVHAVEGRVCPVVKKDPVHRVDARLGAFLA